MASTLTAATDAKALQRARWVAIAWLVLWLGLAGYLCVRLATAWPYMLSPAHLGLVLVCPGILFQSAHLVILWRRRQLLRGPLRWLMRALAIVGGLFTAGFLVAPLEAQSMARFERGLGPFLAQVQTQLAAPCPPAARYVADNTMRAYFASVESPIRKVALHADAKRFVLAVQGRSIDIDGSTIYYNSVTRKWTKYHNDNRVAADVLDALHKDLTQCQLNLPE